MQKKSISNGVFSLFVTCFLSGVLLLSMSSQVKAGSDTLSFKVSVTVMERTCDINKNQPINVDFGEMNMPKIDGIEYEKDVPYTLDCDDVAANQKMRLMFSGNPVGTGLLGTSERFLGIRLKQNGTVFALNEWVPFTYDAKPVISAVPVKAGNGGINYGKFTASATFIVEYE